MISTIMIGLDQQRLSWCRSSFNQKIVAQDILLILLGESVGVLVEVYKRFELLVN